MRHNGPEVFIVVAAIWSLLVVAALTVDHLVKKRLNK